MQTLMNLKKVKSFICVSLLTMSVISTTPVFASENPPADTSTEETTTESENPKTIVPYCILEDPS